MNINDLQELDQTIKIDFINNNFDGNMDSFSFEYFDDKFDVNDLGYLQRNNTNWAGGRVEFRKQEPWGKFINILSTEYCKVKKVSQKGAICRSCYYHTDKC